MRSSEKGYLPFLDVFTTRYHAKRRAKPGDVVVKVAGGYRIKRKEDTGNDFGTEKGVCKERAPFEG